MSMEADMPMLQILVTAVGLTLGSLLVAISLSCLAWWLATRVHHPRWGAAFLLIIVGGTWLAALGQSEFVKMATVFALVGAGLLYLVGREERDGGSSRDTKPGRSALSKGKH
ncbi:MHYT domain-containing protein [Sphingobium ummariense]|uniref:Uncharacterized protein n=4 Tax=Sphingomonadaceae TaxID=41297 RepID=T0K3Z8_9SPHN|nr:hypothetical protein [Sphingobium ummariense]EPR11229.1 hypothetical protein M527_03900 [Sphingobium indicum IP26]KER38009.1 hypothetical protein AL00_01375 [Sphingobium indicum F2]PJG45654.1 hypothetical protein CAF53_23345 [Sphingobium sp. LB126]PNQ02863.1 hypothetical protein A8G00_03605 [Sphingobium sp. SA916]EQB31224.1 hypothetical protein M529_15915 [Sphingobium ummariense RL-3]